MGNFRVTVDAVGNHGCQRDVPEGGNPSRPCGDPSCTDCMSADFVQRLRTSGAHVLEATLQHWPAEMGCTGQHPRDNLLSGARVVGFAPVVEQPPETIMQFFEYGHLGPKLQEVSRPFCELARRMVASLPRNAERTVALRKLLEAKDGAVRAFLAKP